MNFNILQFLDLSAEKLFWIFLFCTFLFGLPVVLPDSVVKPLGLLGFTPILMGRL